MDAKIFLNRGPTYPVWDVYVPDSIWSDCWEKVWTEFTREAAERWVQQQGHTLIDVCTL